MHSLAFLNAVFVQDGFYIFVPHLRSVQHIEVSTDGYVETVEFVTFYAVALDTLGALTRDAY